MTTTDTDTRHDVTTESVALPTTFVAHCAVHATTGQEPGHDARDALERFTCDPTDQRFIIADVDGAPRMTDLGGLRHSIRHLIEYGHHTGDWTFFRWTNDAPHLEPLTLQCTDSSTFDDNDYAHPRYSLTTPNGDHITEITCRIDGRA